jgi:hypothetical protein
MVSEATAGSELTTSAVHTAMATVLAPVIRFADISLTPDSTQNEYAPHRAVSTTGPHSGGEHHVGPIRKFASVVVRLSPRYERDQAPDRDRIEAFCPGHALATIRKANGSRVAVRSAMVHGWQSRASVVWRFADWSLRGQRYWRSRDTGGGAPQHLEQRFGIDVHRPGTRTAPSPASSLS